MAKAADIDEAKAFFDNYVKLCHAYDKSVVDQYSNAALIKRILIYPDGKMKPMTMTAADLKKKLKMYRYLAIVTRYKTNYYNLKYTKEGKNVRLEGQRQVVSENYRTPISLLIGKDSTGKTVILEEILHTKGIHFFFKNSGPKK